MSAQGQKADLGEARSTTNQAVLYGCMPLVPWEFLAWPTPTTAPPEPPHRQRHRQHEVVMLTLAEAGINKKLSSRAQKLAAVRRVAWHGRGKAMDRL